MKSKLVPIGNSRGLRLPKTLLQQCHLEDEVELQVRDGCLVIRPARAPRAGWDAAFAAMARSGEDQLLDTEQAHTQTAWERRSWKW